MHDDTEQQLVSEKEMKKTKEHRVSSLLRLGWLVWIGGLFGVALWATWNVHEHSTKAARYRSQVPTNQTSLVLKSTALALVESRFGLPDNVKQEELRYFGGLLKRASVFYREADRHLLVAGVCYTMLALSILFAPRAWGDWRRVLLLVPAVTLFGFGIVTPLVSSHVYQDFPFVGRIQMDYQVRSLLDVIPELLHHSVFLGVLTIALSLVMPAGKFILMGLNGFFSQRIRGNSLKAAGVMGKLSMVEMLVIAIFILSFNVEEQVNVKPEHAVFLYSLHCLFSVLAGMLEDQPELLKPDETS